MAASRGPLFWEDRVSLFGASDSLRQEGRDVQESWSTGPTSGAPSCPGAFSEKCEKDASLTNRAARQACSSLDGSSMASTSLTPFLRLYENTSPSLPREGCPFFPASCSSIPVLARSTPLPAVFLVHCRGLWHCMRSGESHYGQLISKRTASPSPGKQKSRQGVGIDCHKQVAHSVKWSTQKGGRRGCILGKTKGKYARQADGATLDRWAKKRTTWSAWGVAGKRRRQ